MATSRRTEQRLAVKKTYKLYINGEFPRTESGRYYAVSDAKGRTIANASRASRKDVRNSVVAARKAVASWSGRTAYNRGQILYRIAEVCESRAAELQNELRQAGASAAAARAEVTATIDRLVYYAGWSDKYPQLLGTVNPVSGPYYTFTVPEPTGVVGTVAPDEPALLGLVSRIAPAIVGGNTVVALTSQTRPLPAITFAECLATSDVPAGVVNLLSGLRTELVPWLAAHMDVNLIDLTGLEPELEKPAIEAAAENVKRVVRFDATKRGWTDERHSQSLWAIAEFLEMKTIWHPMGM